jgi:hypothetical protein
MTYTIKGKQYTEDDINERCADLMKVTVLIVRRDYNPCNNPSDTDAIIDKCFDELLSDVDYNGLDAMHNDDASSSKWEYLMQHHNCTKLVAACICLIELNE